jgi:hypothetical protein
VASGVEHSLDWYLQPRLSRRGAEEVSETQAGALGVERREFRNGQPVTEPVDDFGLRIAFDRADRTVPSGSNRLHPLRLLTQATIQRLNEVVVEQNDFQLVFVVQRDVITGSRAMATTEPVGFNEPNDHLGVVDVLVKEKRQLSASEVGACPTHGTTGEDEPTNDQIAHEIPALIASVFRLEDRSDSFLDVRNR